MSTDERAGFNGRKRILFCLTVIYAAILDCVAKAPEQGIQHLWWEERGPVVRHESFPADCTLCHAGSNWNSLRDDFSFDHEKETGTALVGAHTEAQCLRCHNDRGPVQTFAQRGCNGCHEDIHEGQLGSDCVECHSEQSWEPVGSFAMHARTRFPLVGAHAAVACWRCHPGAEVGKFTPTDTECITCHGSDLSNATSPDHVAQGWVDDCGRCHVSTTWSGAGFSHESLPLVGGHAQAACVDCHQGEVFQGTSSTCSDCHQQDYLGTTNPNHLAAGFPQACETCHTPVGWGAAGFNHAFFPLDGGHATLQCAACHAGGNYQATSPDCASCHMDDYNATTAPNHASAGFPQTCVQCHTTAAWAGASFVHSAFPLQGAHATAQCAQCHQGGVYQGTPSDCASCHLAQYQATTNPSHATAGFPSTCHTCHDTVSWNNATFNHQVFPLLGAHAGSACANCHSSGVFQGTPSDCASCHASQYQATTTPNHVSAGFPTTCEACHDTVAWANGTFTHQSFPLTGAHAGTACANCHAGGVFQGTPTDCASCHLNQYMTTTNPNHQTAGFPQSCQSCHDTVAWSNATFTHSSFALTGAHAGATCQQCHSSGVFQGLPSSCVDCHLGDFMNAGNPNHQGANFPQACQNCHNTTAWNPSSWNHTGFPLVGHHARPCNECHQNPGNYQVFSCIHCHAHNQSSMNSEHSGVNGYVYQSSACFNCHPDGNE